MSIGWRAQVGTCSKQFDVDAAMEHPSSEEAVGGCVGCWMLDIGARFGTGSGDGWLHGVEHWVACSSWCMFKNNSPCAAMLVCGRRPKAIQTLKGWVSRQRQSSARAMGERASAAANNLPLVDGSWLVCCLLATTSGHTWSCFRWQTPHLVSCQQSESH